MAELKRGGSSSHGVVAPAGRLEKQHSLRGLWPLHLKLRGLGGKEPSFFAAVIVKSRHGKVEFRPFGGV